MVAGSLVYSGRLEFRTVAASRLAGFRTVDPCLLPLFNGRWAATSGSVPSPTLPLVIEISLCRERKQRLCNSEHRDLRTMFVKDF